MQNKRIVLLAGQWDTTSIVYNYLTQYFHIEKSIIEEPVLRKDFLKKRVKKLGWLTVAGQILFQLIIGKVLKRNSVQRINEIISHYKLSKAEIPLSEIIHVSSVNSEDCLTQLQKLRPDLVIVHGTRIISNKILKGVEACFINIHAGITPKYRGSHGAYWALANDDRENCGVTVHIVDPGIDTGNILFQSRIIIKEQDNFITYPYLQLAEGLQLLKQAISLYLDGKQKTIKNDLSSALWHHPTLWSYISTRWKKGVK